MVDTLGCTHQYTEIFMANSHTEDATGISAAIRTLATKKELGESEKRLNAARRGATTQDA